MKNITIKPLTTELAADYFDFFDNRVFVGTDENDPNTCILRVRLTDAVIFNNGARYEMDFDAEV